MFFELAAEELFTKVLDELAAGSGGQTEEEASEVILPPFEKVDFTQKTFNPFGVSG